MLKVVVCVKSRVKRLLMLPHALKNKVYFKLAIPSPQRQCVLLCNIIYNQLHAFKTFYFNELFIEYNWKIHFGPLNTVKSL